MAAPLIPLTAQDPITGHQRITDHSLLLFGQYFASENPLAAPQAAQLFSSSVLDQQSSGGDSDGPLFSFWNQVLAIADQIPRSPSSPASAAMDKLVLLVRELSLLPDTGVQVWTQRLWADLPVLGAALREHLNGPRKPVAEDPSSVTEHGSPLSVAEQQAIIDEQWLRFHVFSAKLMGAAVGGPFVNQAVWMLRAALEEEAEEEVKEAEGEGEGEAAADKGKKDRDLITAAIYIEHAGPVLVEALAHDPKAVKTMADERESRVLKGGALFGTDKTGLTVERWGFWTRRFKEVGGGEGVGEEARESTGRAARLMEVWGQTRLGM